MGTLSDLWATYPPEQLNPSRPLKVAAIKTQIIFFILKINIIDKSMYRKYKTVNDFHYMVQLSQ